MQTIESQFKTEYAQLLTHGLKSNPLRLEYERKVRELADYRDRLYRENRSEEEMARLLHEARRELGREYKDAAPPLFREYIFFATAQKYGDPLGPDYDTLSQRKSAKEIIESATRPIEDLNNRLTLDGFKDWFDDVYKNKTHGGK